ncbi:MAG TPA: aminoglycoside phosphotransferase [Pseudonocardiaceae bacterium]
MTSVTDRMTGELARWLTTQRWFAGRGRRLREVRPIASTVLVDGDPELTHVVLQAEYDHGDPDRYQVLVGARRHQLDHLVHGTIGATPDGRVVYDAVFDHELTTRLLELVAVDAKVGPLVFAARPDVALDTGTRARVMSAEQSNTSLVYGQRYILKLYRRLLPGISPDVELHQALHDVGCTQLAAPLGSITGELDGEPTTLAMLAEFLPNSAEGWSMATASVRDLMAEADLHAHEVGGDFAGEARRLGTAVATVHADLARALGTAPAAPDALTAMARAMRERLDVVLRRAPALEPYAERARAAFDAAGELSVPVTLQRIHGDLHLGQVLRTPTQWVLIDFEGEPSVPLTRRREPASALRDVAGMLRSFDYAAHQSLMSMTHRDRQHEVRALEWSRRNQDAFCEGYAEVAEDPREQAVLLRALELDKAVYEVAYEVAHRPDWLPIPLSAVARLTAQDREPA